MKTKLPSILYLVLLSILINACRKGCPDSKPIERGVDKSYLPYIIPYSDTGTRQFLKNGKDTLLFKSQGLKETITNELFGESCENYNIQQYSLKMAASDTDYFLINYYCNWQNGLHNDYEIVSGNNYSKSKYYLSDDFVNYFPTVKSTVILNNNYDSIKSLTNSFGDVFIAKPKTGVLKIQTKRVLYELIK
jgi:hypothetical protein